MNNQTENTEPVELSGEELEILAYPNPILKKKALPVETFDDDLAKLCQDMLCTMYNAPGIGLAAPQVGHSIRLFVMDIDFEREEITRPDGTREYRTSNFNPRIFINPKIKLIQGQIIHEEGCLSVPGVYEDVKRVEEIEVEYQDVKGESHTIKTDGLLSVCIQHENDHLEGIVFLQRLSQLKRTFLTKKYLKGQRG